jgi:aspartate racemase
MTGAAPRMIGVLGGMGPLATVDFLHKVIASTPASCDQQHVPMIVHQVPQIPDRSTAILAGTDEPLAPMLAGMQRLARAGAEVVAIPCNTAHYWYESLTRLQPLPILHIAEATRQELQHAGVTSGRIAVLATRGTHRAGIYSSRLSGQFQQLAIDESVQTLVDQAIAAVKAGASDAGARTAGEAAERLLASGAERLILGCTELPVALRDHAQWDRCIDTTLALARACVRESLGG